MKPLNPLLYIKNNFKSVMSIFFSMTLGVFLIYIFSLFSATTTKMVSVASFDLMDKYNIAYVDNNTILPDQFLRVLENNQNNSLAVQMNLSGLAYYRGGMGGTTMLTFNMFEEDTENLLDSFDMELVKGTLPQNDKNEILVPLEYALQNNLSVGDYIGTEVSDEYALQGKYIISGFIQGDVVFALSCQPGGQTKEDVLKRGIMYRVDNLSAVEQKALIDSLPDSVIILSHDYYEEEYSTILTSMQALTYIFTIAMIVILCIALGNLNIVLYSNRRDELKILHSIGFTKGRLLKKLWIENLFVCIGGYIAGIIFTMLVVWLINTYSLIPHGKILELISAQGLITAFTMPIFVSIFSLLPNIISKFKNENLCI